MKKRLTEQQEFEVMKLVLDKFLWLGFGIMAYGLWKMAVDNLISIGLAWMTVGIIVLVLFMIIIVKEYEIIK
ncbi:hypothetical protein J4209_02145 [Candidatus Woesearchaeota archaeon]|nr:hypothetical protein [Candidatus Woesearchaeota archaeon]